MIRALCVVWLGVVGAALLVGLFFVSRSIFSFLAFLFVTCLATGFVMAGARR